jgi:beta-glucosidase
MEPDPRLRKCNAQPQPLYLFRRLFVNLNPRVAGTRSKRRSLRASAICAMLFALLAPAVGFCQSSDAEKKINDTIAKMTLEEKITMLSGSSMMASAPLVRLGIPALRMSDGPVGAHIPPPSTAFAAGIGLAASWDRDLAQRIGVQLGRDARSRGAAFLLGPGVNIYRAPMNGRNFEYFGEDPFLASQIAVGYINGVQSQNVSATIKHFAANNSEYARFTSDSIVSERALREIYLPAFEAAVKQAHVGSIMDSYNFINGEHATQNAHLNLEIAKKQWGFDGIMMSDWTATHDGVAAANAGLDLEMPFGWYMNAETLIPAVKAGKVKEADIDDKIRRILRVAYRFGWIGPDGTSKDPLDPTIPRYNQPGRQAALEGALEGATLLKNQNNLLPLDPAKVKTIAVIGPDAFPGSPTAGGSGMVPTFSEISALKGISDRLGLNGNVTYDRGISKLSILALATGLTPAADVYVPGVTVESFPKPDFSGSPTATRHEQAMNSGTSLLSDPDLAELLNSLTSDMMKATMGAGTPHYDRWTGYYHAREAGKYLVFVEYQGKYRLTIDGASVIDSSDLPRFGVAQKSIDLTPGAHKVVIEELSGPQFGEGVTRLGIAKEGTLVHPAALELAKRADAVIIAVGYDAETETEGADREFQLPPGQDELIQQIAAVNPNTIVVITAGGAVDTSSWIDHVGALVHTWYSGEEGGTALAQLIFGDANPSGRLPISWERSLKDNPSAAFYYPTPGTEKIPYTDDIFVGYRGYEKNNTKPLFPFGFGLSYTTFKYANLTVTPASKPAENPAPKPSYEVAFDVTNTGQRAGADVAQLYLTEDHPSIARPIQELKGFARVQLDPGQTRHVTIPLDARSFAWYDVKAKVWHADAGSYTVHISRSSADPQLEGKVTVAQPAILAVE